MSSFAHTVGSRTYQFRDLKDLMAKATPARSGDRLAGLAAASAEERVAAQMALAELPLTLFLNELVIPYEQDEVSRLIIDEHDQAAFGRIAHLTVGDLRNWLLGDDADAAALAAVAPGVTPEMAAAVSKIMRIQDLILVAKKCRVVTRFRNTIGLAGRMATRLQPNHPTDDATGIAASLLDGLLYGSGDAVIGINPATDNVPQVIKIVTMLDEIIARYDIPTQSCVLTHVTNTIAAIERGAPVDLVFQSIAGTEAANASFGINLALLDEARQAALSLRRGTVGDNVMYFETGQGSALSANAHHGVDQQTLRSARLRRRPQVRAAAGEHGGRFHRPRIPVRRQADHPRRAGGPLLRQAAGPADGLRRLLHQPRRGRPGRHGHAADLVGRGRLHLLHGRPGLGRHHAQLSNHLVPRRAVRPARVGIEDRARIRSLAQGDAHLHHRRTRNVGQGNAAGIPARAGEPDVKENTAIP